LNLCFVLIIILDIIGKFWGVSDGLCPFFEEPLGSYCHIADKNIYIVLDVVSIQHHVLDPWKVLVDIAPKIVVAIASVLHPFLDSPDVRVADVVWDGDVGDVVLNSIRGHVNDEFAQIEVVVLVVFGVLRVGIGIKQVGKGKHS